MFPIRNRCPCEAPNHRKTEVSCRSFCETSWMCWGNALQGSNVRRQTRFHRVCTFAANLWALKVGFQALAPSARPLCSSSGTGSAAAAYPFQSISRQWQLSSVCKQQNYADVSTNSKTSESSSSNKYWQLKLKRKIMFQNASCIQDVSCVAMQKR